MKNVWQRYQVRAIYRSRFVIQPLLKPFVAGGISREKAGVQPPIFIVKRFVDGPGPQLIDGDMRAGEKKENNTRRSKKFINNSFTVSAVYHYFTTNQPYQEL